MRKTVDLRDFAATLGADTEEMIGQFKASVRDGVMESIPHLVQASPVDTGLYAQSWDFTEEEQAVIVGNYAPHAPIIEHGARPFTPPIGPLLAWAKRVLGDQSQPPKYSDRVWALAKHTQKKIEREGMKPRHILTNEIPRILERIKAAYARTRG